MFRVQVTYTDYPSGNTRQVFLARVYKTRRGAETAARRFERNFALDNAYRRLEGIAITHTCIAEVMEVPNE